jgi:ribosome-associated protein
LLDYSDLVVHIQSEEARRYYMLDRLWNDCPKIDLHLDLDTRSIKDVQ